MKHVPSFVLATAVIALMVFGAQFATPLRVVYAQSLPPPSVPLEIPASATLTGSPNVLFVKEIHRKGDVPYSWHSQTTPYHNIIWLSDGYFVAAGTCSPAVQGNNYDTKTQTPRAAGNNIGIQGGMYVFKDDGTFIKTQNVCYDGGMPGPHVPLAGLFCNEGAACETSMQMIPTSGSTLIRELYAAYHVYGRNRPPIQYKISSNKVSVLAKPFSLTRPPLSDADPIIGNLVKVGDRILGVKQTFEDNTAHFSYTNVLYTPSFGLIREWSVPTPHPAPGTPGISGTFPLTQAEVLPYSSVGDYVIGLKLSVWQDPKAHVFKMSDDGELSDVGTLPYAGPNYLSPLYDPTKENQVAFLVNPSGGDAHIEVYEPDNNGIKMTRTYSLPGVTGIVGAYAIPNIAILGDYTVYEACPAGNGTVLPVTGNTADPFKGCRVRVLKGDAVFAEFPLPKRYGGVTEDPKDDLLDDKLSAVSLAPNGNLIIGTQWGYLYLYKLGVNINPGGGGNNGTTTPPLIPQGALQFNGLQGSLDLAKGYILLLQALLGKSTPGAEKTIVPEGTSTQFQMLFNDAANIIKGY